MSKEQRLMNFCFFYLEKLMARDFAKAFYHSKEWQQVRDYCLRRDKYLCVHCGMPAEEVHHVTHLSPGNINDIAISLNPVNLVSLCRACHFDEHRKDRQEAIDKANGKENPYEFDENGFLVLKPIPPV